MTTIGLRASSVATYLTEELASKGGILAVISILFAALIDLVDQKSTAVTLLKWLCVAGTTAFTLWSFRRALTLAPKYVSFDSHAAKDDSSISTQDLALVRPKPVRLGVVGIGDSGKTTLLRALELLPAPEERTRGSHAILTRLPASGQRIALIDGQGDDPTINVAVAEQSDVLLVVLDHSEGPKTVRPDHGRLNRHKEASEKLRIDLSSRVHRPSRHVHVLMNKRDLWERSKQKGVVEGLLRSEHEKWRTTAGNLVTSASHSNNLQPDIATLTERVRQHIREFSREAKR